jgi:hypothetical protein
VFEATVVRVEPWGPVRINSGVALVFRLAEYKIDKVAVGQLTPGSTQILKHLACNHNELDDLKPGDKVTVVAAILPKHEKRSWMVYPATLSDNKAANNPSKGIQEIPFPEGNQVVVSLEASTVAKIIYPTTIDSSKQ